MTVSTTRAVAAVTAVLALTMSGCSGHDSETAKTSTSVTTTSSSGASSGAARTSATADLPSQAELAAARRDVSKLSVSDLAGQVVVGGYVGTAPEDAAALVRAHHLAGVILMGDNVPQDVTTQMPKVAGAVQAAMAATGRLWPGIVATDQEGGPVARFGSPVTQLPAGMAYGAAADAATAEAATQGEGQELRALGLNMVFAPDADVTIGPADTTIAVRSPGEDPQRVAAAVNAEVAGFQKAGLVPVIKHFPGHGSVTTDTHVGVATQTQTVSALMKRDWLPFAHAITAGAPAIMSAHIIVKNVDPSVPGTLSPKVLTGQLRDKLGFHGLIVTDAMNMGAIAQTYDVGGAAAVSALKAGADVILMPRDLNASLSAIVKAVNSGALPKERLVDAASRIVATMRHQQVTQPSVSVVGAHGAQAAALARKSITQIGGACGADLVGRKVTLVGGAALDRQRMTSALAAKGVTVGAGGTSVVLFSSPRYNAGVASAAGGSQAKVASGGGAPAGGRAGVEIAFDTPYQLAARPAGGVGIAAYDDSPATVTAVVDVLTGAAKAQGTLPVSVGSAGIGTSACAG